MLTEILKENTKQPHQELETIIIHKIKQLDTKADYVKFLKVFYGFIAAVEEKLTITLDEGLVPDLSERRKADSILQDIAVLDQPAHAIPLAETLPQLNSRQQALGAMYVLEGSTLGGKYISKMIGSKLGLSETQGLSYFNGYNGNTEIMWEKFKAILNSQPADHHFVSTLVDTANQTFQTFKQWINEQ